MMLFYKLRPLLRSAQVEKELAALNEDFTKLKEAYDRSVRLFHGLFEPCLHYYFDIYIRVYKVK